MDYRKLTKYTLPLLEGALTAESLAGLKAITLSNIAQSELNIPTGFVITGKAFDDFLIANQLVEPIIDSLNKLGAEDITNRAIADASNEIQTAIITASMPTLIEVQIEKSYEALSEFSESYVAVRQSAINNVLDEYSYNTADTGYVFVKGMGNLVDSVKRIWADLFSIEAISYRLQLDYEGSLTQAVLVQKMIVPEVSGLAYNFDLNDEDQTKATVIANLGISDNTNLPLPGSSYRGSAIPAENSSDYYLLSKTKSTVIYQKNRPQRFMLLKSKSTESFGQSALEKVKVSKVYSESEKLSELDLRKIISSINQIEANWGNGYYEIEWLFEGSKLYVISLRELSGDRKSILNISWDGSEDLNTTTDSQSSASDLKLIDKRKILSLIRKDTEDDVIMSDEEREEKSKSLKKMLPEIKTVTQVWGSVDRAASELRVLQANYDGVGIFQMSYIAKLLGMEGKLANLENAKDVQKKAADYLALYLNAATPKPVMFGLEDDISLEGQLAILSQLKNLYGHRNFYALLPQLSDYAEIAEYKRRMSAQSFQRTNQFKIYQQVSSPIYLVGLEKVKEQGIDGIVINLDDLLINLTGSSELDVDKLDYFYADLMEFVGEYLFIKGGLMVETLIYTESTYLLENILARIVEFGLTGVFYAADDLYDFKDRLAKVEQNNLDTKLRKRKKS
jgi:pyruvate,water dikinase